MYSKAEAIINPVNCVGVSGKGLALQFKESYPLNYRHYREACESGKLKIGRVHVFSTGMENPKYIINFPTKNHWREKSKLEYIELGLEDLKKQILNRKIKSIALPKLGCGLGGLSWKDVKPLIISTFGQSTKIMCHVYD